MKPQTNTQSLSEIFIDFVEHQWGVYDVYSTRFFVDRFGTDFRLTRYQLMRLVDQGELCLIKFTKFDDEVFCVGSAWYARRIHLKDLKQFEYLGIRVI